MDRDLLLCPSLPFFKSMVDPSHSHGPVYCLWRGVRLMSHTDITDMIERSYVNLSVSPGFLLEIKRQHDCILGLSSMMIFFLLLA